MDLGLGLSVAFLGEASAFDVEWQESVFLKIVVSHVTCRCNPVGCGFIMQMIIEKHTGKKSAVTTSKKKEHRSQQSYGHRVHM